MHPNKWYYVIYTKEGPVYDRRFCQKVPIPVTTENSGLTPKQLMPRPPRSPKIKVEPVFDFSRKELVVFNVLLVLSVLMVFTTPIVVYNIYKRVATEGVYIEVVEGSSSRDRIVVSDV